MEIMTPFELYDCDFSLSDINAMKQRWGKLDFFSCIGKPKKRNMLLFLCGYSAEYSFKGGEKIYARSGSIVYTPAGSEYTVRFFAPVSAESYTVGVNFSVYNPKSVPCVLSDSITVFTPDNANYKSIFNKLSLYSEADVICLGKIKSVMYDLLFKLSEYYRTDYCGKYRIISKGITYLEQEEKQELKIGEIAALCNVSEVYFRKLFKEYSGMSPTEYRTLARLCRAKVYLRENRLSVAEISDLLGFGDVSYFIKLFREANGITPREYRNQIEEKFARA